MKRSPVQVSVIIPNLHSTFIDKTLASFPSQDFDLEHVEVLVVGLDDPDLVREDSLVRFISTEKPVSPAIARNIGIREVKGDIICFTDADCLPSPDWLRILTASFQDETVAVVGGGVDFEADNYWTLCDNLSWFHELLTLAPPGERGQLASLNLAVRRQVIEDVGLFNESYPKAAGEDAEWTLRMRQKGYSLTFTPAAVVKHCPVRADFKALWQHGYTYGCYSVKINPAFTDFLQTPLSKLLAH